MTQQTFDAITITPRAKSGKGESGRLRRGGNLPIMLTAKGKSEPFFMKSSDMRRLLSKGVTESTLLFLQVAGNESDKIEVFIKDYQIDYLTDEILHVDFYRVTRGQLIQTHVPIRYDGTPIGIKSGGILEIFIENVHVECFPRHLPSEIRIKISDLDLNESLHGRDLPELADIKYLHIHPDTVLLSVGLPKVKADKPAEKEETAS